MTPNRLVCGSTLWRTPIEIVEEVRWILDGIALDPCTESSNPCRADAWYDGAGPESDGLTLPWRDRTYANPPFGEVTPQWVLKAGREARISRDDECKWPRIGLLLSVARSGTPYFHNALLKNKSLTTIFFFEGRLRFSEGGPSNMDSWMYWFNVDPGRVSRAMSHRGTCLSAIRV